MTYRSRPAPRRRQRARWQDELRTQRILIGAFALVWTAEIFNTAIEALVDLLSPERRPLAGKVKDLAAGAVLAAALGALAIGAVIFGPKLWALWVR